MKYTPVPLVKQKSSIDQQLDAMLTDWFEHYRHYTYGTGQGHRSASSTTQDYRTPAHLDWFNGAADERAEKIRLEGINECMDQVPNAPHRWRTALEFHARNLYAHITVWYSPVLPATREEREVLILEARNKLLAELRRKDLIG
jgi:hypothetical protein